MSNLVALLSVPGRPVPQGSMRSFEAAAPHGTHGRIMSKPNNAGRLERWRGDVRTEARRAMGDRQPVKDPVKVLAAFEFARPKSHLTPKGVVRTGAPLLPRPDVDKLARAVLDAMTGIVYDDDSQVGGLWSIKVYGDADRATITITTDREVA